MSFAGAPLMQFTLILVLVAANGSFVMNVAHSPGKGLRPRLQLLEPLTVSAGELQLQTGDTLALSCEGAGRLQWTFPLPDPTEVNDPQVTQVEEEEMGGGRWRATLRLRNASFFHTGNYTCAFASPSPSPAHAHSQIYVYVADPEYPWVRLGVVTATGKEYEKVVLDCRPNNRSTHIRLFDIVGTEIPLGLNPDAGWTLEWSPISGFTMGPVDIRDGGIYMCKADGWVDDPPYMVILNVMSSKTNLQPPTIHAVNANPHAVLGHSLELRCSVTVAAHVFFDMTWKLPPNSRAQQEGRLNVTNATVHFDTNWSSWSSVRIGSKNLTIVNVSESDAGLYTCLINDHTNNTANSSFHVDVKELRPRLQVLEPLALCAGAVEELQLQMGNTLVLSCEGAGRLNWTFPLPDLIEVEDPSVPQVEEEEMGGGRWRATLRLRNASFFHTGNYTCAFASPSPSPAHAHSQIYVYVADPEYPWVRLGVVTAWGKQYEPVVLDCRPNNRSTHVRLIDTIGTEIPLGLNPDAGWTLKWSPVSGFTMGPVDIRDGGIYICKADGWEDVTPYMVNLYVMSSRYNLPPPTIHAVNANPHAVLGHSLELKCSVTMAAHVFFDMTWKLPPNSRAQQEGRLSMTNATVHFDPSSPAVRIGSRNLTIVNLSESDAGLYTCLINDHTRNTANSSFHVDVKDGTAFYIDVLTEEPLLHQKVRQGMNATWSLRVVTFPPDPTLSWFGPDGKQLSSVSKYPMHVDHRDKGLVATFYVLEVDVRERGTYVLKINTSHEERVVNLTLTVIAAPVVELQPLVEPSQVGKPRSVWCRVVGFPLPKVEWTWRRCPGLLRDCSPDGPLETFKEAPMKSLSNIEANSTLQLVPDASGYITCRAQNSEDTVNDTASLQVTDLPGRRTLEVWGPDESVSGDLFELWCGALKENHTSAFWPHWERLQGRKVVPLDQKRTQQTRSNTSLSLRSVLRITNLRAEDQGVYECKASDIDDVITARFTLTVEEQQSPFQGGKIIINNTEWQVTPGQKLRLPCPFFGRPRPTITWYKDGKLFMPPKDGDQFRLEDGNRTLVMAYVTEADQGEYRCSAANRVGTEERWTRIVLRNRKPLTTWTIVMIVIVVILFIVLVPLSLCVYKERKRRRMIIMGLRNFRDGQPDVLNPELPADEQTELLPYDGKWEFPREHLKLGKQLGAGAFGVVLKAEAYGIVEGEEKTTVAVKMVKRTANFSYLKALASELKIMVHLGRHLNVVNLLGACTANIERQELLVIVEFCRFGNLHNYLLRHREGFVDQVDPRTGCVDASIGADRLDGSSWKGDSASRVKYASLSFSGSTDTTAGSEAGSEPGSPGPVGPVDYREAAAAVAAASGTSACGGVSVCVDSLGNETISMSPTGGYEMGLTSNGSAQPHWRSNYRGDYRGGVRPICTRDLLCWSYQVARGMQYLARRKVLHGDLAARNILLADGNIVKICDFGLAKSMYKSDNYKKKGDGPLPVKWMALESIRDGIFSTQSDVWSFGIVLWELFSLAQTPYPGMLADERLYAKLQDGYRMEKPPYATDDLYRVMNHCWVANPVQRPSFDDLSETLGSFLEESVRNHYLDLNNAYIDMNEQWQRDGATDYLGMLGAPDYYNLVTPRREEEEEQDRCAGAQGRAAAEGGGGGAEWQPSGQEAVAECPPGACPPSPGANSGYLMMRGSVPLPGSAPATPRSAEVFSPRPGSDAQVFTFAGPRAPAAATYSPSTPFASYTPNAGQTTALDNPSYSTRPAPVINPSADNYVNMPQHRMAVAATESGMGLGGQNGNLSSNGAPPGSPLCTIPDAFSNPSYVTNSAFALSAGQQAYA